MASFLTRRILTAIGVVIAATYIFYLLVANAGDPLEDLRTSTSKNKDVLIAARTRELQLDVPPPLRYFYWASGALEVPHRTLRPGEGLAHRSTRDDRCSAARSDRPCVSSSSPSCSRSSSVSRLGSSARFGSTADFDYGVTFASFLVYSLPSFWVAVLLKQWGAIGFNDFLANPHFPLLAL